MAINEIHMYDAGTSFEAQIRKEDDTPYPLNDATKMEFWFQKPDQTYIIRTAEWLTDGTDGWLTYLTDAVDLDQVGTWRYQAYIEKGPVIKHSDIGKFKVYANLPLE